MVVIQQMPEDNGQWEPRKTQSGAALVGRLQVVYARKRMTKRKMDAVFVGGTPAALRRAAEAASLVVVWPARKTTKHPAIEDQNLCAMLKRMKLPIYNWTVIKLERLEA